MRNRFLNALLIQGGACNPIGVAHSLVEAMEEAGRECPDTEFIQKDPAVRMICHQLAYLLDIRRIDDDFGEYERLIEICERRKHFSHFSRGEPPC